MRTRSKPLSAAFVKTVKTPGRYGDGGRGSHGLYLRVWIRANGRVGKSWGQRVRINGRLTNLGLGPYPVVTLASARGQALENSRAVYQGRDPRRGGVGSAPTFEEAAERVIRLRSKSWKSPEQVARQWRQLFRDYAFPVLGAKALDAITRADVLAVVAPVWVTKPPTAKRTLERMSVVLRWGMVAGHIEHNVADVGAITAALPSHRGLTTHHRAIAHPAVAGALAKLRDCTRTGPAVRLAIELAVLTAGRSVEVRGARWSEIDMDLATWTVPAGRMKGGREHRVPLSAAALAVLRAARQLSRGGVVFASPRTGRAVHGRSMGSALRRCGIESTVHGLARATFSSWAADEGVDRSLREQCLAHSVRGVEGVYQRSDLFDRRRAVMTAWASHVAPSGEFV